MRNCALNGYVYDFMLMMALLVFDKNLCKFGHKFVWNNSFHD